MKRLQLAALVLSISIVFPGCGPGKEADQEPARATAEGNGPSAEFASTITVEELKDHIAYLASDELEGRLSGTEGAGKAAEFIARHFRELGLKGVADDGSYKQKFRMVLKKPLESFLESEHGRVDNWDDFMELHVGFAGEREVELVFAGYGRDADFRGLDLQGKLAAFFMGSPERERISNDFERVKIEAALKRGAAGTLLIVHDDPPFLDYVHKVKPYIHKDRHYLERTADEAARGKRRISISSGGAARLFGISASAWDALKKDLNKGRARSVPLETRIRMVTSLEELEIISGENVLGYLEGTGGAGECLVVTAHYDHLGTTGRDIYNGAYDNAAGVAALMEIAEAFKAASESGKGPLRSVIFLTPDAEEIGGLGTRFYLENPIYPLSATAADINIDGIGREDAERPGLKDFVHLYLSRNGKEDLAEVKEIAAESLSIDLKLVGRNDYGGSDHAFFEEQRIPAVAFSTGHPRDHHQPSDTADKLDYRNIRDIARFAFAMAWEIASRDELIQRNVTQTN